ncbi:hypothetical protein C8D96_1903 [Kushneria marisflavi]|nr:hypothetical protein C8D96_1903 [Kushneria marisflavi]
MMCHIAAYEGRFGRDELPGYTKAPGPIDSTPGMRTT